MANAKKSSASQRREEVRKQRERRFAAGSSNQTRKMQKQGMNPWVLVASVLVGLIIVIGVFIWVANQSSGTAANSTPASTSILQDLNVKPDVFATVGQGSIKNPLTPVKDKQPILKGPTGKPEMFYEGAEFCPYCAGQRWAMIVALNRFGSFTHLDETTSAADDVYANTPTFTFYHSVYTSQYVDFVPLEEFTNKKDNTGYYGVLQTPTPDEEKIIKAYNAPPYTQQEGFPFIDIANQYLVLGPSYLPDSLDGQSQQAIAASLSDPNATSTQNIVATANYLTAAICKVTNNQPASVCTADPVPHIEQSLGQSGFSPSGSQIGMASDLPVADVRRQHG